jgi:hypothetical protein
MSENLIFPINYHIDIVYVEKIIVAKGWKFLSMRSSLSESVIVTEIQATEAYSSLDLTKARYSISKLSKVGKNIIL